MHRAVRHLLVLMAAAALGSCGGGGESTAPVVTPTKLGFSVQPQAGAVSGVALGPIAVSLLDAGGTLASTAHSSITLSISSGSGIAGATLGGTLTRAAVNGVATFSDITLDKAGAGYTITATASGLANAVSQAVTVSAGAPSVLAFTTQPTNAMSGAPIAPAVQVEVRDAAGNPVTTSTIPVTLLFAAGSPPAATISGTSTQSAVAGVATFSGVSIDKAGSTYAFLADAAGLNHGTSATFTITPGVAATLGITTLPPSITAGATFTASVQVIDAHGNATSSSVSSVTIAITGGTGPAGQVLGGSTTLPAPNGFANFTGLTLNRAGAGTTLTASATGLAPGTSASSITVLTGPPAQLAITTQPANALGGGTIAPVKVAALDAQGNPTTSFTGGLGMALTPGTGALNANYRAHTSRTVVAGVTTFSGMSIDKVGTGYTLTVGGLGTNVVSAPFDISVGPPGRLSMQFAGTPLIAGVVFSPVHVFVNDSGGNFVATTTPVTLFIDSTQAARAVLSGTLTQSAVNGVATFDDIVIDRTGPTFAILARSPGLASAGAFVTVNSGPATRLKFTVEPTNQESARTIPFFAVEVQDSAGYRDIRSSASITLALTPGAGSVAGALTGTVTVAAVQGKAIFGNLGEMKVGTGFTLTASTPGLASDTSAPFSIGFSPPNHLTFTTQPASTLAGTPIAPAVEVSVFDNGDNLMTALSGNVTMTAANQTGAVPLHGTTTQPVVGGVATFNDLALGPVSNFYQLNASLGAIGRVSSIFAVIPGLPRKLQVATQPATTLAGYVLTPALTVLVQDSVGNTVTSSSAPVSLSLSGGTAGATLGGTLTRSAVAGVATFADLAVDVGGTGYTIAAGSTGLTSGATGLFTITSPILTIATLAGDTQTVLKNNPTNVRPAVLVTNASGPVAGIPVTFAVTGGGGSITGNATVNTDARGVAQVGGWVTGLPAGPNSLTATGTGQFQGGNSVTFTATAQGQQLAIDVRNIGPALSPAVQAAFTAAASYWQSILYGDLSDVPVNLTNVCGTSTNLNETIDDIVILARLDAIDGPGNVLGNAGACNIRGSNGLPVIGLMQFDTADVRTLSAADLNAVILHEMGHVLGFSFATWNTQAGITQRIQCGLLPTSGAPGSISSQDTHFTCIHPGAANFAVAAFDSIGGTSYSMGSKVPLENCTGLSGGNLANCGSGTYNSHWRESVFGNELMTGYLNSGANNPLSLLTIASFRDEGYLVNYAAAQAYSHAFHAPGLVTGSASRIFLGNDELRIPVGIVDDRTGQVLRVVQPR